MKVEAALEKAWGFAFPRDLFAVWDVARAIDRKHPLDAFLETIGVRLEGPFYVLAGAKVPSDRGRWASDPPEFFTIASGDTDGLHWGYVVHDPGKCDPVCAHFHSRDGYPITIGTTLFDALRKWLMDVRGEKREELAETKHAGEPDAELEEQIAEIDRALAVFAKHPAPPKPKRTKTIAPTLDGLGVVCAKDLFAPSKTPKPEAKLALARQMLAKGKPGGALKIARDAYAVLPAKHQGPTRELLADVYAALGRPALAAALGVRKPERAKKGPRHCSSFEDALEDLASVRSLVISYPSKDQPLPKPEHWAAMKNLERVILRGIPIDLPASFAKLPLRMIEIFDCRPKVFPRVLARMHGLEEVSLHGVRDIPDDWKLPNLRKISIHDANLRTIPTFVLRARKLYNVGITKTAITEVPDAFGALVNLGYLSLARNRIRVMPDIFDRFPKLFSLWLDQNRLATLPDSIARVAKRLDSLGIGKNPLVADKAERARIKKLLPKTKIFWT